MASPRRRTRRKTAGTRDLPVRRKKTAGVKGGSEVLVALQHGNVRPAYVLGGLWNGSDRPPTST